MEILYREDFKQGKAKCSLVVQPELDYFRVWKIAKKGRSTKEELIFGTSEFASAKRIIGAEANYLVTNGWAFIPPRKPRKPKVVKEVKEKPYVEPARKLII